LYSQIIAKINYFLIKEKINHYEKLFNIMPKDYYENKIKEIISKKFTISIIFVLIHILILL